jgi:hypothetical protein
VTLAVAAGFDVPVAALRGPRRDRDVVRPRHIAMYLMRELTGASLAEIGAELGGRDHSTVLHGHRRIATALQHDTRLRAQVEAVRARIEREVEGAAPASGQWSVVSGQEPSPFTGGSPPPLPQGERGAARPRPSRLPLSSGGGEGHVRRPHV